MRRPFLLLVAALAALVLPAAAFAHAQLLRTFPANGAVVAKPPTALRVVFDDVVVPGPGIEAIRNGGGSVLAGTAHVVNKRTLVVPLRLDAKPGAYSVRWSIVSDDGHNETGIVAFAVGRNAAPPTADLTAGGSSAQPGQVAWRWVLYAGLLTAVGAAILGLVIRPRDRERLTLLVTTAAVVAAVGAGEEAHRAGLDTRAGQVFGGTALAAVAISTLGGAATLVPRLLRPLLLATPLLVVGPPFAGHAFDHGVSRAEVPVDALHLAAAAAWIGALLGLVAFRDAPRRRTAALAAAGVGVLAVTGVVRAWSELKSVDQLWDASYGRALLVKTGILLAALAAGWLLRTRARQRAGLELGLVAGIVVAVSVLVLLPPGRTLGGGFVRVAAAEPSAPPPAPPAAALLVAKEMGQLGVVLELQRGQTTAVVLSPAGGGLDGLDVRLDGATTEACGSGCYRAPLTASKSVDVLINRFGPPLQDSFAVPPLRRPGADVLARVARRYRALRSVFFLETLSSGPSQSVASLWRVEAPDRVSFEIPGGASGIVIGDRRWDRARPDATWEPSAQTPLEQPVPPWTKATNVHVVADDGETKTLTFADPATPAYFQVQVDAKTMLPREVRMTAAAHFMVDRYVRFNAPRAIFPPR